MTAKQENNYNKETCEVILDTSKTAYLEELDRFKQIESKVNIALALNGVLLAAYLTYLGNLRFQSSDIGYIVYTNLFKIVIIFCLGFGILYFLKAIEIEEYDQVRLDGIVAYTFARESVDKARMQVAATYKEVIDLNREKIKKKSKCYNKGHAFLISSLLFFLIHFIIEEVIKYVH